MAVVFKDYSANIKAIVEEAGRVWLLETGNEVASTAKDTCALDGEAGTQLRGSYRADVRQKEARVGTPLEAGWWEEWGTGEHAVRNPHRSGWWVYKEGYQGNGGDVLTEAEAKAIAARNPGVHATNGRDPSYTLEKAFKTNTPKMEDSLQRILNARLGT